MSDVRPATTMTADQAAARLDEHLRLALEQLSPEPRIEPGLSGTMDCDDPTDGGPLGRVFVEAHWWLRDVPPDRNRDVFDALHRRWESQGYVVIQDLRDRERAPQLKVRHPGDGFAVSLRENLAGELRLSSSSPCVWPDGVPPPPA
jgi:hypothetical protein